MNKQVTGAVCDSVQAIALGAAAEHTEEGLVRVGLGPLRGRVLTPSKTETTMAKRGFPVKDAQAKECLESAGAFFLDGFKAQISAAAPAEATAALQAIQLSHRGFAFEGAGMAATLHDALNPLQHSRLAKVAAVEGGAHEYLVYVGAGWALARLPRMLWRRALRGATDPVLQGLILDGLGFHQAYFRTTQFVHQMDLVQVPIAIPFGDATSYAQRGADQGIGRAMWFVAGADPQKAATLIRRYPDARQADLFSGLGLATAYAGGLHRDELLALCGLTGSHRAQFLQGAVFAIEARARAGNATEHTQMVAAALFGNEPEPVARLARSTRPDKTFVGEVAYDSWRLKVATLAHTMHQQSVQGNLH